MQDMGLNPYYISLTLCLFVNYFSYLMLPKLRHILPTYVAVLERPKDTSKKVVPELDLAE